MVVLKQKLSFHSFHLFVSFPFISFRFLSSLWSKCTLSEFALGVNLNSSIFTCTPTRTLTRTLTLTKTSLITHLPKNIHASFFHYILYCKDRVEKDEGKGTKKYILKKQMKKMEDIYIYRFEKKGASRPSCILHNNVDVMTSS